MTGFKENLLAGLQRRREAFEEAAKQGTTMVERHFDGGATVIISIKTPEAVMAARNADRLVSLIYDVLSA